MEKVQRGCIIRIILHAADLGMAHTGSSSVTNAKQINHTPGVYTGKQGPGIQKEESNIPLNRNTAASPLMRNPSQWMKGKRIT